MRADNPRIDKTRLYEIVDLPPGNAWRTSLDSSDCVIGTIVRSLAPGEVIIIKGNGRRNIGIGRAYIGCAAILRPLTQKEQAKIQQALDMLPETN